MNTHNLEKLNVYHRGSVWLRIYLFGYLFGLILVYLALMLNELLDTETWNAILTFYSGGGATYEGIFSVFAILLILTAVADVALLPMLNRAALIATLTHLMVLALYRPLIWLFTRLFCGSVPAVFGRYARFLIPLALIYSGVNLWYFCRRKDLFSKDIVNLVTGEEKDQITSIYR